MAEYYHSEIRSIHSQPTKRHSTLGTVVDLLAMLFMVPASLALLLTLFVADLRPTVWIFPLLGLVAPATYLLNLSLALYWIIRWRWLRASLPLLLVVLSSFQLDLFLRLPVSRDYGEKPTARGALKVMTYNVRQFYGPDGQASRDSLMSWVGHESPDVICFQEFRPRTGKGTREMIDSLLRVASGRTYYSTTGDTVTQQAVYSRYKILRSSRTCKEMKGLRSIWADILVGSDTLRVFSSHLHSTSITSADDEFLSADNFLLDTAREEKVRSIVRRYCDNSLIRAVQADTIACAMARSPYRLISCGDLNDTPTSYVYQTVRGGLQDAFCEAGRGYSYTFLGFRNLLRIDYVLLDPSFEVLHYETPLIYCSDHLPVLVTFKR